MARRIAQPPQAAFVTSFGPASYSTEPLELDRLGEDLAVLDHEIAETTVDDPAVRRLLTIAGINVTVALA